VGIIAFCSVLLAIGLVLTIRWGSHSVTTPDTPEEKGASVSYLARRYIWSVSLLLWTGIGTGLLVTGPAARLAMRLLAVAAGSRAQGRLTEAEEVVGRISADGTIGIFVFVGVAAGLLSSLTYVLLRRWLPAGRAGGLALGLILLIVMATRIEPLRPSNEDFDLVGPSWLSIAVYTTMALVQGMAVVAFAGRISHSLPLPAARVTGVLPHLVLVFLIPAAIGGLLVVLAGVIYLATGRTKLPDVLRSSRVIVFGRAAIVIGVLVALPGFVSALADIAGRGPG
jgi:hypothetical protein